ncbi:MAG: hypothetical protein V1843_03150 [bacterium]
MQVKFISSKQVLNLIGSSTTLADFTRNFHVEFGRYHTPGEIHDLGEDVRQVFLKQLGVIVTPTEITLEKTILLRQIELEKIVADSKPKVDPIDDEIADFTIRNKTLLSESRSGYSAKPHMEARDRFVWAIYQVMIKKNLHKVADIARALPDEIRRADSEDFVRAVAGAMRNSVVFESFGRGIFAISSSKETELCINRLLELHTEIVLWEKDKSEEAARKEEKHKDEELLSTIKVVLGKRKMSLTELSQELKKHDTKFPTSKLNALLRDNFASEPIDRKRKCWFVKPII